MIQFLQESPLRYEPAEMLALTEKETGIGYAPNLPVKHIPLPMNLLAGGRLVANPAYQRTLAELGLGFLTKPEYLMELANIAIPQDYKRINEATSYAEMARTKTFKLGLVGDPDNPLELGAVFASGLRYRLGLESPLRSGGTTLLTDFSKLQREKEHGSVLNSLHLFTAPFVIATGAIIDKSGLLRFLRQNTPKKFESSIDLIAKDLAILEAKGEFPGYGLTLSLPGKEKRPMTAGEVLTECGIGDYANPDGVEREEPFGFKEAYYGELDAEKSRISFDKRFKVMPPSKVLENAFAVIASQQARAQTLEINQVSINGQPVENSESWNGYNNKYLGRMQTVIQNCLEYPSYGHRDRYVQRERYMED